MKIYRGTRNSEGGSIVSVDGHPLDPNPSLRLWNHSPDGFNWGYGGSGPAQLALAILLDVYADPVRAVRHHQAFKWDVIAGLSNQWEISEVEVRLWMNQPDRQKKGD